MSLTFTSIACELHFTSSETDAVYAILELFDQSTKILSSSDLLVFEGVIPNKLYQWLVVNNPTTIVFESRSMLRNIDTEDWGFLEF